MTTQEMLQKLDEMQNQFDEFKNWLDGELERIDEEIEELKNMKIVEDCKINENDLFEQKQISVKKNHFNIFDFKNIVNCEKQNYSQLRIFGNKFSNNYGWLGWEFLKGKACPRALPYYKSGVKNKLERGLK
jgi:small-conductance mechanosensitive channel